MGRGSPAEWPMAHLLGLLAGAGRPPEDFSRPVGRRCLSRSGLRRRPMRLRVARRESDDLRRRDLGPHGCPVFGEGVSANHGVRKRALGDSRAARRGPRRGARPPRAESGPELRSPMARTTRSGPRDPGRLVLRPRPPSQRPLTHAPTWAFLRVFRAPSAGLLRRFHGSSAPFPRPVTAAFRSPEPARKPRARPSRTSPPIGVRRWRR